MAAIQDPNPKVDGRGFEKLRAAGIAVEVGVEQDAASRLNRGFLKWQVSTTTSPSDKHLHIYHALITAYQNDTAESN